jgi:hypothetical protein
MAVDERSKSRVWILPQGISKGYENTFGLKRLYE